MKDIKIDYAQLQRRTISFNKMRMKPTGFVRLVLCKNRKFSLFRRIFCFLLEFSSIPRTSEKIEAVMPAEEWEIELEYRD